MNLPVYKSVGAFASLKPGTVSALIPILLGRNLSEEIIAIATGPKGPVHYSIWSLADLEDTDGPDAFETALDPVPATWLWLVGSSADLTNVASAVSRLLDFRDTQKWSTGWGLIAVTADGSHWGYVDDHVDQTDHDLLHQVPALDPLWANVTAIAVKAKCAMALETTALGLDVPEHENGEMLAIEHLLTRLRANACGCDAEHQFTMDRASLLGAINTPGAVTEAEAINLGLALAASPDLQQQAINWILTTPHNRTRIGLWRQITRCSTGPARTLAATLTGLAAWRAGDLVTVCAAVNIAYPGRREQPAAGVLAELVWTGIGSYALVPTALGGDERAPFAPPGPLGEDTEQSEEA